MTGDCDIASFIEKTAREAGEEALLYFRKLKSNRVSTKKTDKDLVSEADKAVEQKILQAIRAKFPDHGLWGEETGQNRSASPFCWVIDPIDGTQSFVRQHPFFSISIALTENGKSIAGGVYAPALGLYFSAEKGKGTFRNGERIHCSDCASLSEACGVTGFACVRARLPENNLPFFSRIVPVLRDIKRDGSAALDLCFLGAGVFDLYWEMALQPYDVAAGMLVASEAGASVCDLKGGDRIPEEGIAACSPALRDPFFTFRNGK